MGKKEKALKRVVASESSDATDSDEEAKMLEKKKAKKEAKRAKKKRVEPDASSEGEGVDDNDSFVESRRVDSDEFPSDVNLWQVSEKIFCGSSTFKKKKYATIREFYSKDGKMLPGPRGLNMNADVWKRFVELVDKVDCAFTTSNWDSDDENRCDKKQFEQSDGPLWKLSETNVFGLSTFKGNKYIAIRQYYQKDGKYLPTKKGVNLKEMEWSVLKKLIPTVTKECQF